jgi:hypothetical protein
MQGMVVSNKALQSLVTLKMKAMWPKDEGDFAYR